jgi:hypothetical protein
MCTLTKFYVTLHGIGKFTLQHPTTSIPDPIIYQNSVPCIPTFTSISYNLTHTYLYVHYKQKLCKDYIYPMSNIPITLLNTVTETSPITLYVITNPSSNKYTKLIFPLLQQTHRNTPSIHISNHNILKTESPGMKLAMNVSYTQNTSCTQDTANQPSYNRANTLHKPFHSTAIRDNRPASHQANHQPPNLILYGGGERPMTTMYSQNDDIHSLSSTSIDHSHELCIRM